MEKDAELIMNIWDAVRDVIPASKREDTAFAYFKALEDHFDMESLADHILGNDKYLDAALREYVEIDTDDEYDDNDDY